MKNEARVLVVDDEPDVVGFLRLSLPPQGLAVLEAGSGADALLRVRDERPDLVLLDLGLPDMDGFDVLAEIRALSSLPVIIVTVRSEEEDKVRGLELGADDYVTKPFSPRELGARIKALIRRSGRGHELRRGSIKIDERLQVNWDENEALVNGTRVALRPTEARLLSYLVENAGRTVSFESILANVWGPEYREEIHYVQVYVTHLRQKLEPEPSRPRYILTKRGVGYGFRALGQAEA